MPWNQETSLGYLAEICLDVNQAVNYLFVIGIELVLFISLCLHHQAFYKMFQFFLRKFDCTDPKQNNQEILCELIRFHVMVEKCVRWKKIFSITQHWRPFCYFQLVFRNSRHLQSIYSGAAHFIYNFSGL